MKIAYLFFLTLMSLHGLTQVPQKVVVEHFTNSVCGVCAARNPGFYKNLRNQKDVLHVTFHPSSPYSSCKFNQFNKVENDDRTNYYGIYGATPRFVIQGSVVQSGTDINSNALFTNYISMTSPASIKINQVKYGMDSIKSTIVIKTMDNHSLGNLKLMVALVEDTVFYKSPNGENEHYDVFRKALTSVLGNAFTLPKMKGDSIVLNFSSNSNSAWNFNRIYTLVILQEETTKKMIQVEASSPEITTSTLGVNPIQKLSALIFPNPVNEKLEVQLNSSINTKLSIYNLIGKQLFTSQFVNQTVIDFEKYENGSYFIILENESGRMKYKFIK